MCMYVYNYIYIYTYSINIVSKTMNKIDDTSYVMNISDVFLRSFSFEQLQSPRPSQMACHIMPSGRPVSSPNPNRSNGRYLRGGDGFVENLTKFSVKLALVEV